MRINKFISANSEFSRRKADELISKGLVKINGEIVKKLGTQINPSKDLIEVNNISIKPRDENIYIALNKPEEARELLGWEPGTSLREGLRTTIPYFRRLVKEEDAKANPLT